MPIFLKDWKYQNRYPVIFLTLKNMIDSSMELSLERFASMIQTLVEEYPELYDSEKLSQRCKNLLKKLEEGNASYVELSDCSQNVRHR